MSDKPSCSLYAILARESPWAVIFRRGPSRFVQLIRWNTKTDKFDHGQWFRGRIYERIADLSPSGNMLIYLSTNWRQGHPQYGSYIVISRPPYLTALALFSTCGTWDSCGYFQTEKQIVMHASPYLLSENSNRTDPPADLKICRLPSTAYLGERNALLRAGWIPVKEHGGGSEPIHPYTLPASSSKCSSKNANLQLLKHTIDPAVSYDQTQSYSICQLDKQLEKNLGILDWCDFDKSGDLVFAKAGQLFRLKPQWNFANPFDLSTAKLLYDFGPSHFTAMETPSWATEWD
ncbi:MAG: hypothetical protein WCT03_25485 [Candidatus Obscuribacterales bacterium]